MTNTQCLFLDAGHGKGTFGFNDDGASGFLSDMRYTERDFVVDLARRVYAILRGAPDLGGAAVYGVGVENRMKASEKTAFINNVITGGKHDPTKCIAISLHLNAGGGHGSEFWTPTRVTAGTQKLSQSFVQSFTDYKDFPCRTPAIKPSSQDRFGRLYIDDVPGITWVLVESFFVDNAQDLTHGLAQKDRLAEQIAHAVLQYVRS